MIKLGADFIIVKIYLKVGILLKEMLQIERREQENGETEDKALSYSFRIYNWGQSLIKFKERSEFPFSQISWRIGNFNSEISLILF